MRSSLSLERLLFAHQKRQIAALVQPASPSFRRYERRYQRATARFRRVIEPAEVVRRAMMSDVVYMGDYHTLRLAQHGFADLVEAAALGSTRRVVLALEFVEAQKQQTLDAFLSGKITEQRFLKRIGHGSRGGFEIWPGFRRVLEVARRLHLEVVAIDRRAGGRASLERRDRFAAAKIAQAASAVDRPQVFVLMGQFHVAPAHLPRRVTAALRGEPRSQLIVYQNAEGIWWSLARRGLAGTAQAVDLDDETVCLLTASPVVCQRSFLDYVEAEAGDSPLDAAGLTRTFQLLASSIAKLIGLRARAEIDAVEVITASEPDVLAHLARRGRFSVAELRRLERELSSRDAVFVPRAGAVWLAGLSLNHAAEEAAHLVRWVALGAGDEVPRRGADAFWAACFEEALRFFGSRLVNPARRAPTLDEWVRRYHERDSPGHRVAAYLLSTYAAMAQGAAARPMLPRSPALRLAVYQGIGHLVGDALAEAFSADRVSRAQVRDLFSDPLTAPSTRFAELALSLLERPERGWVTN
jgi:hypothetical protein